MFGCQAVPAQNPEQLSACSLQTNILKLHYVWVSALKILTKKNLLRIKVTNNNNTIRFYSHGFTPLGFQKYSLRFVFVRDDPGSFMETSQTIGLVIPIIYLLFVFLFFLHVVKVS